MNIDKLHSKAFKYGQEQHQDAHVNRHHAFANSVVYLVTGMSGGAGPSVREHLVSWALAGDGHIGSVNTNLGSLTVITPDSRVKRAGEWSYAEAILFAEPIVYGQLPELAKRVYLQEHCFDDDPADLEQLRG